MRTGKLAVTAGCVALALSACGTTGKPLAGTPKAAATVRKGFNDPRTRHIDCLRGDHVDDIRELYIDGHPAFQVGTRPSGPTVVFWPTAGAAQEQQISGDAQGAEVIGAALVYPNQAPAALLDELEPCIAAGVSG